MRRVLFIFVFVLVGLIGIMAIIPLFFKNSISRQIKTEINSHIEGKVDFSEFHISLFNQFPKVEIALGGLNITGTGEFSNDTLASADAITGTITISELFNKKLKINNLKAVDTNILLKTAKNGAENWNIIPAGKPEKKVKEEQTEDSGNGMEIMFDKLELDHFNLKYVDVPSAMVFWLKNTSALSKGKISGNQINFDIQTESDEIVFEYNSVKYISNIRLKTNTQMLFDSEKMSFQFSNGNVWLNNLPLKLEGSFAMPSDSMYFDLKLNTGDNSFKNILALVPATYQTYLEKIQTSGNASISAAFTGWYYEDTYPAIQLNAKISDGTFKYADLPEQIDGINVNAGISKPQGNFDGLVVDISPASASLHGIPVNGRLRVTTPVSDPQYEASLNGEVDFSILNKAIPMEGINLQGKLKADLSVEGRQSDVDKEAYDKFKSNGKITLNNFVYHSETLKQPVNISSGEVAVTTPKIEIKNLDGNIGQSHFVLTGFLAGYLPYFLRNGILKGDFSLNSGFVNLTELVTIRNQITVQKADSVTAGNTKIEADSILAFEVPERLDLKFRSDIKKAIFDKMELSQVNGLIAVHGQSIELSSLTMEMLKGKLTVDGSYTGNKQLNPDFDFNLDAENLDVQSAYRSLRMIRRYLPVAAFSQGEISTRFSLKGKMNEKLEFMSPTLDGSGSFTTRQLMIINSPTFNQLKGIIKSEKLKNVKVDDFTASFEIEKGNILIKPFTTQIADQETTVQGKISVESKLDFDLGFKLNREDLGTDINKGLDLIPGSQNIKKVDVGVKITGPAKKPEVSVDLNAARKQIMNEVKKAGAKEIQDKAKKIGNELRKLFK